MQCNAACGSHGIKYRTVRCVWYGSNRHALNGCRNMTRPADVKDCKGPPCAENCKYLQFHLETTFFRKVSFCPINSFVSYFNEFRFDLFCFSFSFLFRFYVFFFICLFCLTPFLNTKVHCKDTSRYCTNVLSMGLCKLHRYQQKCCKSCRTKNNS